MRISDWSSDVCSSDLAWPGPCGRGRLSRRARRQLVLRAGRYRPGRVRGAAGARARVGSMVVRGGVRGDAGVDDLGVGTVLLALDPAPGPGRGAGILRGAAGAAPGGLALARAGAWVGGVVGGVVRRRVRLGIRP